MMNLKVFLGLFLVCLFAFTACQKDSITTPIDTTNKQVEETSTVFVPADEANMEEEMALLDRLLNGEFQEKTQEESISKSSYCCVMNSISKAVSPWGLVNLNLKYDVSETTQQVRIKHWHKPAGGSYTYVGEDQINSYYSTCTSKSINMSVNHLPDGGVLVSWARTYDGPSYCGSYAILWDWTK